MSAFDRIIGYETVKKELYQIIDMIKNKDVYQKMGAKLPTGVLISGRPGIGKTMLANALIEESGVKAFIIKKNRSKRETIAEINDIFLKAKNEEYSIILIDDIDKFSESDRHYVDDEVFVTIQACLDSVKDNNVLIVATSNNSQKLPCSLTRSGRFDRKINLKAPTASDAKKIIEYYMKDKCVDPNLNYEDVSKMISYTSCSDLETIINESAIYAASERKEHIDVTDITKAHLRGMLISPDENYKCSEERLDETAIHEAGHAVVAEAIKDCGVGFITIKKSGRNSVGGITHLCEEYSGRDDNILIALGGKVATELFYNGKCGYGCQNDLAIAFNIIRERMSESGTSGIGMIDVSTHRFPTTSESLNSRNESVVHAELERYLFIVREILLNNKELLLSIAKELKEKEVLLYSDIQKIKNSTEIGNANFSI